MLKQYKIIEHKLVESEEGGCPVLVYVCPDEKERKHLVEELKIDEHNVHSALDPNELSRVEFDENHAVVIIKRPKRYSSEDNFIFKISSIGLFIFPDKLVVIRAEDAAIFDAREFQKIQTIQDVVLRIIRRCILHFEEHLHVLQAISDELEEKINQSMENKQLHNMFGLEKSLVYYLKAISSNSRAIEKLKVNTAKLNFNTDNVEYLDDLAIENSQCYEQANTYSQVLSSLMDARVSIVSNNLNILIKKLTFVMISIMVPTLIISAFSMNVKLPMDQEHSMIPFWIIMSLSIVAGAAVYLIWRFKKL
ncbi:MAG: magnesium transporter CorA family protein [Candidatus Omnitrophota bacterium]